MFHIRPHLINAMYFEFKPAKIFLKCISSSIQQKKGRNFRNKQRKSKVFRGSISVISLHYFMISITYLLVCFVLMLPNHPLDLGRKKRRKRMSTWKSTYVFSYVNLFYSFKAHGSLIILLSCIPRKASITYDLRYFDVKYIFTVILISKHVLSIGDGIGI